MNYEQAHKFVLSNGLYMPTPQIFMNYFCNVLEAFDQRENKSGAKILDGNGQPVIGKELEDIYKHLTKDCIAAYKGGKEGVWTWLNARFIRGSGFNGLDLETITGMDSNGNLQPTSTPLLTCHNQNAYVNLQFNNQGLATTPSGDRDYKLGKNINFWTPVKDCVVRFNADFYGADLSCNGYPASANASLGLFACAEGAVQKFNLLQ
jgi:hypothetical protein